jgi:hypothetical protein
VNRPRNDRGLLWGCQNQKFSGEPIFSCMFFCCNWIRLKGHISHSACGMFVKMLQLVKVRCFNIVLKGPINTGVSPSLQKNVGRLFQI